MDMNRIAYGAVGVDLDVRGRAVREVRDQSEDLLNIGRRALVYVNGRPVKEDHVIREGDRVEFAKNPLLEPTESALRRKIYQISYALQAVALPDSARYLAARRRSRIR